jgi:SAM-dependent methyltransferase
MGSSDVQGPLWGAAAEDWLDNERFVVPVYDAVFDALELGAGTRLLDVGCGAGLALQMAAQRGASVAGIDASEGLLEIARRRLPDADLRRGDLEQLPYSDDSFDLVTSFNAVQFAADPVAALAEAKRVAVVGGDVVIVTFGDPERCGTRHVLGAVGPLMPPAPPGAGGPFALSAPGKLEELARAAGLTPGRAGDVEASFTFANLDEALRIQMSAGPLQLAVEHSGEAATRDALKQAFEATARQDDGTYRHNNVFRYLIARA